MTSNPNIYSTDRVLTVRLPGRVSAKLATFRREEKPEMTDEEAAAYLIEEHLGVLGMLDLTGKDEGDE